jgi:hypothetical protein
LASKQTNIFGEGNESDESIHQIGSCRGTIVISDSFCGVGAKVSGQAY